MDHHGHVLAAVAGGILQIKAAGQLIVQLNGAALPGTAQRVLNVEVQLGAVERAVAGVHHILLADGGNGVGQSVLCLLPVLPGADVVLGHGGQFDLVGQAKQRVDLVEQAGDADDLILDLVLGQQDVGVVLGEAADTEHAVERAGELMTVDQAQLTVPQGQVSVGMGFQLIDQNTAGAVHGLDGKVLAVNDGGIHIILVVIPVAGGLPQSPLHDLRSGDLHIVPLLVDLTPVVDQGVLQHHALRQVEGEAGGLIPESKQAQFLAQLPVIPALGLLDALQIGVQFLLLGEGDAVDPLEGLPVGVAPPVGGVAGQQLDGVALYPAGGVQMGTGAQVGELALLVEGDGSILRQILDQFHLIRLALLLHELNGFLAGQLEALQLQLLLADLPHLGLDLGHVLRGKGKGCVHIVVPALLDGGADGQLHLGPQALDGLRHDVRAGVPVSLAVFLIFKAEFLDFLRHSNVSFPAAVFPPLGQNKNASPLFWSGVRRKAPRFHPACTVNKICFAVQAG